MNTRSLCGGFLQSAQRFPDRPAVSIKDESISYDELASMAAQIGHVIESARDERSELLTGVFGHRSFAAFAGVLGTLFAGDAYVPLNTSFPEDRTLAMLERARLDRVVVESASLAAFLKVVASVERSLLIVVPDQDREEITTHHRLVFRSDLSASITRMATLASGGRIGRSEVAEERDRLVRSWGASTAPKSAILETYFDSERIEQIDLFDRAQLSVVLEVCRNANSMAAAGRMLFAASRLARTSTNDSDRVRKYLSKFGLDWKAIRNARNDG